MTAWLAAHEALVRVACFGAIFAAVALAEIAMPRRRLTTSKRQRWSANIGIVVIDTMVLRLFFPAGAVGVAIWVQRQGWGLLSGVQWPAGLEILLAIIFLDLVVYLQHVMFHAVPTLWRVHMMHHADMDFDLTTGTRFHPVEILVSMGIKAGAILAIGAAPSAVLLFEMLLNGTAMFNHGNFMIPAKVDRLLRWLVVTPDMHRVHHSIFPNETNSNYGFNLPWWDRLMGTYKPQPRLGHDGMTIGLRQFRDPGALGLGDLLRMPFVGKQGAYAINRKSGGDAPR
jgi:sterol desaturase/sphingolipid hydroxylase (fatty acid hydroxylase superfamily)